MGSVTSTSDYPDTAVDEIILPNEKDREKFVTDLINNSTITKLIDAVEAIEGELGVSPAGGSATVVARFDAQDTVSPVGGAGTDPSVTGLTISEYGAGGTHTTLFELSEMILNVANTTGVSFGGTQIYTFPSNSDTIVVLNVYGNLTFTYDAAGNSTPIDSADGGDFSLGTSAPDDGTLSGTDVDIHAAVDTDPLSGGLAFTDQAPAALSAGDAMYLNGLIDDADVGDGADDDLEVNGYLIVQWLDIGAL